MNRPDVEKTTRLFLILAFLAILVGIGGCVFRGYLVDREQARLEHEEKTHRVNTIQEEKTRRTQERSQTLRDIVPWSKRKDK